MAYYLGSTDGVPPKPRTGSDFPVHGARGLYFARTDPGKDQAGSAKESGGPPQQSRATGGDGTARPEALQRLSAELDPDHRHIGFKHRAAAGDRCGDQSANAAILRNPGVQVSG